MRTIVVRYQTTADQADENQRFVEKVFAQLSERAPTSFDYTAMRLDDGVTFVHVVTEHEDAAPGESLADLPAFQEFVAGVGARCEVQPVASAAHVVGAYRAQR